ncbi:hypothetical protein OB955_17670 [Halobacteria archaeon AArc-m2/3/4]|uniref:DUF7344 domain-containing protein n=1 Tax=Natronoglomus mannanivorans TaxID=2979990 RepID=A0AAP2YYA6_9EURY|nr:hypothetical protein [Halobacteria archaeon AArc-xg1-1]MCU4974551.1 hypothetical protein [Halobacteria archaeon AArc-m2/3/4]
MTVDDACDTCDTGDDPVVRRVDAVSDDVFTAMQHRDRRYTLYFLLEHDGTSVDELADVVTGWTHVGEYGMVGRADWTRVYTALLHQHLPMMESAGLLVFDREGGVIDRTEWSPSLVRIVRLAHNAETNVHAG